MGPRFDVKIEAHAYYSEPLAQAQRSLVDDIFSAINESIERACYRLRMDGVSEIYRANNQESGDVSLCVGPCPAVGEHIHGVACTISLEWDEQGANVVTTWHEPYEHLNR